MKKTTMLFVLPAVAALYAPSMVRADDATVAQPGNLTQDIARDQFDINKDVQDQSADQAQVRQDRENLRSAHNAYLQAVQLYGANSSQAATAQVTQNQAQVALHQQIGDIHTDAKNIQADRKDLVKDQGQAIRSDQYDLSKDVQDLKDDKSAVRTDRSTLRDSQQAYQDAVKAYGTNSTQALTAKGTMDKAQMVLHEDLGDIHKEAKDIRVDRRQLAGLEKQRMEELKTQYKQALKDNHQDQAKDIKRQLHDARKNQEELARQERHDVEQDAKNQQRDIQKQEQEQQRAEQQQRNSLPPMGQQSFH